MTAMDISVYSFIAVMKNPASDDEGGSILCNLQRIGKVSPGYNIMGVAKQHWRPA